jgi:hypothetical protein
MPTDQGAPVKVASSILDAVAFSGQQFEVPTDEWVIQQKVKQAVTPVIIAARKALLDVSILIEDKGQDAVEAALGEQGMADLNSFIALCQQALGDVAAVNVASPVVAKPAAGAATTGTTN